MSEELLPCLCLSSADIGISVHLYFLLQFHFLHLTLNKFFLIATVTYTTSPPPQKTKL